MKSLSKEELEDYKAYASKRLEEESKKYEYQSAGDMGQMQYLPSGDTNKWRMILYAIDTEIHSKNGGYGYDSFGSSYYNYPYPYTSNSNSSSDEEDYSDEDDFDEFDYYGDYDEESEEFIPKPNVKPPKIGSTGATRSIRLGRSVKSFMAGTSSNYDLDWRADEYDINALFTFDSDQFDLSYEEPRGEFFNYALLVINSGVFEEIMEDLETIFNLPERLSIVFTSGKPGPLYYDYTIHLPYEFMMFADWVITNSGYVNNIEDRASAIINICEFVLYHELGHAIVEQMEFQVESGEEDLVDQFAAVIAADWELVDVIIDASEFLALAEELEVQQGKLSFTTEHSMGYDRMEHLACVLYGSNPEKYGFIKEDFELQEGGESCIEVYQEALSNWRALLADVLRNKD